MSEFTINTNFRLIKHDYPKINLDSDTCIEHTLAPGASAGGAVQTLILADQKEKTAFISVNQRPVGSLIDDSPTKD